MNRSILLLTLVAAILFACSGVVWAQTVSPASSQPQPKDSASGNGQAYQSIEKLQVEDPGTGQQGLLSAAQKQAMTQGYLVPDQATYERLKDEANAKEKQPSNETALSESVLDGKGVLGASTPDTSTSVKSASSRHAHRRGHGHKPRHKLRHTLPSVQHPLLLSSSLGAFDPRFGPSDSTSAAGLSRYVELVNSKFQIYDRSGSSTPIAAGTINDLVGSPGADVFDPQVIWDPDTNRFYYTADDVFSSTDNRLAFGFSKTDSPSSAADWCKYTLSFGSTFPDYPKLGDTQNFLTIGVDTFNPGGAFLGSDLAFVAKPGDESGCPSLDADVFRGLRGADNSLASTPVPANQTDGSGTGYAVAVPASVLDTGSGSKLSIFQTTESGGSLELSVKDLAVPTYSIPASAQQPGTSKRLDTLDARNTQAVSGMDPSRGDKVALWTQHTIFGGGGAMVRWYEIDPSVPAVFQSENVAVPGLYVFNGAISPDRVVNDSTRAFGDSMVLDLNFSSTSLNPAIVVGSKIGSNVTSFTGIGTSPTHLDDFTCSLGGICRWGDYAAATPDPATPSSEGHGRVLTTTQFVRETGSSSISGWGSVNLEISP